MSSLRNQLIDRIDVLNKVKELFLIPKLNMMSMRMVADFYEVDTQTIRKTFTRHQQEIEWDGVRMLRLSDFDANVHDVLLLKKRGKGVFITLDNGQEIRMNSKTTYFPPRAVLRIGMLLRDSEVAKEVRTQLLNTFECALCRMQKTHHTALRTFLLTKVDTFPSEKMSDSRGIFRHFKHTT